ncbi:hypothetical protein [Sulfuricurvum sp.]|uniref:hypothetical protein n=1 Tax=Sulfuricurvum sp. TaxID=2025608 RepID=UPI00260BA3AF|nr:hypothetical protein [Sulfuricurvum sp.]MDD4950497.1 hypothetical protein [Sulfuricurvum sp.]
MKTFLERINDLAAQYITMPLQRFFLYITIGLLMTLIVIALVAPLSIAKFMAVTGLYITSVITALLAYGNYQINNRVEVETESETILEEYDGEIDTATKHNNAFVA